MCDQPGRSGNLPQQIYRIEGWIVHARSSVSPSHTAIERDTTRCLMTDETGVSTTLRFLFAQLGVGQYGKPTAMASLPFNLSIVCCAIWQHTAARTSRDR